MDLFVYADESGVLDPAHNDYYTFGGLILLGKGQKDEASRRYLSVERKTRAANKRAGELKACHLSVSERKSIFRSLNPWSKFGVVVDQKKLYEFIWKEKKTRQRYLDFVFKIGLKRALQGMMNDGLFHSDDVANIHVIMDEHTTATDGRYELKESLETEFKHGMSNFETMTHFMPLFPGMGYIDVEMRNSEKTPLVRAADIVANRVFHCANSGDFKTIDGKVRYIRHP